MTALRHLGRVVLLALGLLLVQAAVASVLPPAKAPDGASLLSYVLASNLLIAVVLVRLAERSPARGRGLVALLFAAAFGIPAIYLLEAVFFDIGLSAGELRPLAAHALLTGMGAAVLTAVLTGKLGRGAAQPLREVPLRGSRLALSALSYVFVYFAAGMIAWPFLRHFYEGRAMPALPTVALVQVFRGAALSLLVWLIARHEPEGGWRAALSAGLTLSIIGGVAPLLIPNAYLPDGVRYVHLVEVGISNLLFGTVVSRLADP